MVAIAGFLFFCFKSFFWKEFFLKKTFLEQGEVYSWGDGKDGKLGNGKERNRYTPLAIAGLRGKYVTRVIFFV